MERLGTLLAAAALLCGACRGAPARTQAAAAGQEAAFMDTEWKGQFSGALQGSRRVVRSEAEWRQVWAEIGQAVPAAPDFKSLVAAAVFLGQRSTGGFGVKWLEPDLSGPALVLRYKEIRPRGMTMQVLTQPFAVKLFPRTAADIRLEEQPD